MKVLCAVFLAAAVLAEVVPGGPDPAGAPESKKIGITLPHTGTTIQIVADNPVEKVYTESSRVTIASPTGEVLRVRPKHFRHSAVTPDLPLRKKKRTIQYDNPFVQKFYAERGGPRRLQLQRPAFVATPTSDGVNPINPSGQTASSYSNVFFMSQSQQYMLSHNIDLDIHYQKLKVAFSNLQNLEAQFHSLVGEFADPKSNFTIDPNTRDLLLNYVAHIDYIASAQAGTAPPSPPPIYDYYTHNSVGIMDLMTLSQWEYFKQQNTLSGMIAVKTSPLMVTPHSAYGSSPYGPQVNSYFRRHLHGHHHHRRHAFHNRRTQDLQEAANQLRLSDTPSPYQGYARVHLPQKLAKDQLAVFILLTEGVKSHYETLYRMLPKAKDVPANVDSLLFQDALAIFHKVSQFASITFMTLESIWNDLNEIDIFFKAIPNTMLNTLSFYRLDDDFLTVKCQYGNNTMGVARLNADFGNLTADIQKSMDQVLVDVYNCKMDLSAILARTQPYRDFKGEQDLYSEEMQRVMRMAIADVAGFWEIKAQIDQHVESLRVAQVDIRAQDKTLWKLLEKHRKEAGVAALGVRLAGVLLALLLWK